LLLKLLFRLWFERHKPDACAKVCTFLSAPDQDAAALPQDPVLEPNEARFDADIRFNPDALFADIRDMDTMVLPGKFFEGDDAERAIPVHNELLPIC